MAKRKTDFDKVKKMMLMQLKAPDEWFAKLDEWREKQDAFVKPSRPAAIRWIVFQFLLKQEQHAARTKRRRRK